ncbi:sigma-54-dependent Fis family transcriptional regulator [Xanthobacter aminoxidans]|uniref:Sigma-54-dependent Fis family transcriptional regulator n=1 Tax=Xanthobacter aminoxidans TaxID=186280 RepID=A0ABW6ZBI2_9HYPH
MRQEQVAHIDELMRAASGLPVPSCGTRDSVIMKSWQRCVSEHRLDPVVLREPLILPSTQLREHQDAMDEFTHTARFGVETLYRDVAGLGYVLLLTDAKGITVDFIGDPTFDATLMRAGLYLGADWKEPSAGTCAVGTCIATGEALVVHQTDHFDATHIPLTCTAAPVFDPSGALAAVLDISALRSPQPKESQLLALQLVKSVAHKIETANLLNRFRGEFILRLAPSPEFADVDPPYVLAVDSSGCIAGFNSKARALLRRELEARPPADAVRPLVGRRLSEFIEIAIDDLPRLGPASPVAQRMVRLAGTGTPMFAHCQLPARISTRSVAAAPPSLPAPLAGLHGGDAAMATVTARAARLVNTQMNLIVCGETGTGKEFLAKAIHAAGARSARPFVAVNCAALPETLIEGELFGYEAGAFTGAVARGRKGLVLEADGGTLFLDEIGDMPLTLQTRLLRVLAEREVTPLGRTRPVPVNIRVIAATHRDLLAEVNAGRFREDLYFRLSGAVLTLPPLRRRADFEWLVERLLEERGKAAKTRFSLSPDARDLLRAYRWPGNIRELMNTLDFACALAAEGTIQWEDLPERLREADSPHEAGAAALSPAFPSGEGEIAQDRLLAALRARSWNISAVARDLGVDRTTIHRRMRRYGIARRV